LLQSLAATEKINIMERLYCKGLIGGEALKDAVLGATLPAEERIFRVERLYSMTIITKEEALDEFNKCIVDPSLPPAQVAQFCMIFHDMQLITDKELLARLGY